MKFKADGVASFRISEKFDAAAASQLHSYLVMDDCATLLPLLS